MACVGLCAQEPGLGSVRDAGTFPGAGLFWVLAEAGTWRTPGSALQGDLAGVSLIPWFRLRLPEEAGSPVA